MPQGTIASKMNNTTLLQCGKMSNKISSVVNHVTWPDNPNGKPASCRLDVANAIVSFSNEFFQTAIGIHHRYSRLTIKPKKKWKKYILLYPTNHLKVLKQTAKVNFHFYLVIVHLSHHSQKLFSI